MRTLVKPPVWFWVAGVLLLVWGLIGVGGFVADRMMTSEMVTKMSDYDRQLRASQPGWTVWAYGLATVTGLLGSLALLMRRRAAQPLYVASLVFVVVLFGYVLGATDIIAAKGFGPAAGLPIVIALLALFSIWLASLARRRRWIG